MHSPALMSALKSTMLSNLAGIFATTSCGCECAEPPLPETEARLAHGMAMIDPPREMARGWTMLDRLFGLQLCQLETKSLNTWVRPEGFSKLSFGLTLAYVCELSLGLVV